MGERLTNISTTDPLAISFPYVAKRPPPNVSANVTEYEDESDDGDKSDPESASPDADGQMDIDSESEEEEVPLRHKRVAKRPRIDSSEDERQGGGGD
ncbi:hypothetical protein H0H93_004325 [Arthromyces matolae]|nr:hypothetical protein H0H93_004325 [Arthromyces matolae]